VCEMCAPESGATGVARHAVARRTFIVGLGGAIAGTSGISSHRAFARDDSGVVVAPGLVISPRDRWGADLVAGELRAESDVRFLLVHHTAGRNDYGLDEAPAQMRQVFAFHTGAEKRWPDVAYNFFVDRFGGVWEGRTGSLAGPLIADATGGSQGFAQLVCLLGNFVDTDPTVEMLSSLERVLAWLADRHLIDTSTGATTSFASRGSNRWPAGSRVTVRTISGHRDVSQTACPGDRLYARLVAEVPEAVARLRGSATPPPAVSTEALSATASSATASSATASSATAAPTTERSAPAPSPPSSPLSSTTGPAAVGGASADNDRGRGHQPLLLGASALVFGGLAAGAVAIRRRRARESEHDPQIDRS
jgi:hypothetical protein